MSTSGFNNYIQQSQGNTGAYISMLPVINSEFSTALKAAQKLLPTWTDQILHCTLIYDTQYKNFNILRPLCNGIKEYIVSPMKIDWISGHDNKGYVIIVLDAPKLIQRFQFWRQQGCKHSHPSFLPHITIADGITAEQFAALKPKIDAIKLPATLRLNAEYVERIRVKLTTSTVSV